MADDVTLDYVARKSGVSTATASRALNGRPGVAEDVRDRVRLVAQSLNYRPNRAAQNLAGGRTSVVGLVLGREELRGDLYASSLVQSMAKAADQHDEGLMLLMTNKEPGQAVSNLLRDGLVDGVVVSVVAVGERWVEELLDANVAAVLLGSHPERDDLNVIDVENLESSASMVGHLLDTGCRRVGTVMGSLNRVDAQRRLDGYRLAHDRRGLTVDESLVVAGDFSWRRGYEAGGELVDLGADAVFAANDESALGVVHVALERGLTIPDDLSVAGFDGTSAAQHTGPRLTTVVQPFDELADVAIESLVAILAKEQVDQLQLVEPQLRLGETTRALPTAEIADARDR